MFLSYIEKVRNYLGFADTTATLFWLLFAPLPCILVLIRSSLISERGMAAFGPPGESFALRDVRASFVVHLVMVIPWCFLGVLQFVPVVRKSVSFQYHRIAGRIFLVLSIIVAISGLLMASRAFGGGFTGQVGTFVLFVCVILASFNGFQAIRFQKNIPAHRDWMIRLFAYGTSIVTLRLFMGIGVPLCNALRLSTTSKCDVILSLLGAEETLRRFPACGHNNTVGAVDGQAITIIKGSFESTANVMASLQISYDNSFLLALFVHACLAEFWIRERYYTRKPEQELSSPSSNRDILDTGRGADIASTD